MALGFTLVWATAVGVFTGDFCGDWAEVGLFGSAVFVFVWGGSLKATELTGTPALTRATAQMDPASSRASAVTIFVPVFLRSCIAKHFLRSRRSARSAIAMTSSGTPSRRSVSAALTTRGALK